MKKKLFVLMFLVFIISSCDRGLDSPESLLRTYVQKRFLDEVNKDNLSTFLDGKLLEQLSLLDNSQLEVIMSLKGFKLEKIKILSQVCEGDKCHLTYTITYEQGEKSSRAKTTVKKVAMIKKVEESWKIVEVSHVKTLYDFNRPIDIVK